MRLSDEDSAVKPRLPYARTFWELVVYQKARQFQGVVFTLTKEFPREERYSLIDQFRRATRSIGAQIAEAWAKRAYPKHFASKLSDGIQECNETQHWIITAVDDGYLKREQGADLMRTSDEIGRMLFRMAERAEEFCQDTDVLRETSVEWFTDVPDLLPFDLGYLASDHY